MPEASWTTMDAEEFKEQPEELKVFANFYISQFSQRDLEIMDAYDTSSNTVDINHYLLDNIHFTRKNLVKHALQYHDYNFQSLLDEIAKKDKINPKEMTSYEDWNTWYEKRRREIPNSLS
ncbi:hypothetical protein PT285_01845 [Lactobacillus sp. ESL0791]|nr:hypothetical protein [Lactobacillus sp. ESL0791]